MAGVGGFRGVSADQDVRYTNKTKKAMAQIKFPKELDTKVDVKALRAKTAGWAVIKEWIAKRVTQLLGGLEEEVLIGFIFNQLEINEAVKPKEVHVSLIPFLEKNTSLFMKEMWSMLISASENASGVPQQLLDEKAAQLKARLEHEEAMKQRIEASRSAAADAAAASALPLPGPPPLPFPPGGVLPQPPASGRSSRWDTAPPKDAVPTGENTVKGEPGEEVKEEGDGPDKDKGQDKDKRGAGRDSRSRSRSRSPDRRPARQQRRSRSRSRERNYGGRHGRSPPPSYNRPRQDYNRPRLDYNRARQDYRQPPRRDHSPYRRPSSRERGRRDYDERDRRPLSRERERDRRLPSRERDMRDRRPLSRERDGRDKRDGSRERDGGRERAGGGRDRREASLERTGGHGPTSGNGRQASGRGLQDEDSDRDASRRDRKGPNGEQDMDTAKGERDGRKGDRPGPAGARDQDEIKRPIVAEKRPVSSEEERSEDEGAKKERSHKSKSKKSKKEKHKKEKHTKRSKRHRDEDNPSVGEGVKAPRRDDSGSGSGESGSDRDEDEDDPHLSKLKQAALQSVRSKRVSSE